jgi:DnaD/phage-associated family protein
MVNANICQKVAGLLEGGVEDALICRAVDEAVEANKRNWSYVERVVNDCFVAGVLSEEGFLRRKADWKARKQPVERRGVSASASPQSEAAQSAKAAKDAATLEELRRLTKGEGNGR